jgi:CarD family transcriptional regulator
MPEKWHARSKRIQEKLGTGDILEVAQVVRGLAVRQEGRDLPTGEKQMYSKALKILASELMYARGLTAEEAESLLGGVLEGARADRPAALAAVREPARAPR